MSDGPFKNASGDVFMVRTVWIDGVRCRECGRVIRVRERAASFTHEEDQARWWTCRDCILNEPVTENNPWLAKMKAERKGEPDGGHTGDSGVGTSVA